MKSALSILCLLLFNVLTACGGGRNAISNLSVGFNGNEASIFSTPNAGSGESASYGPESAVESDVNGAGYGGNPEFDSCRSLGVSPNGIINTLLIYRVGEKKAKIEVYFSDTERKTISFETTKLETPEEIHYKANDFLLSIPKKNPLSETNEYVGLTTYQGAEQTLFCSIHENFEELLEGSNLKETSDNETNPFAQQDDNVPLSKLGSSLHWPSGKIYYRSQVSDEKLQELFEPFRELGFQLIPIIPSRKKQKNFVNIILTEDSITSRAHIGRIGGEQYAIFSRLGTTIRTFRHELGHVLGLHHPSQDYGAEASLRVNKQSVLERNLFQLLRGPDFRMIAWQGYGYYNKRKVIDTPSIMHISPFSYTLNGNPTITDRLGVPDKFLSHIQSSELSLEDKRYLSDAYASSINCGGQHMEFYLTPQERIAEQKELLHVISIVEGRKNPLLQTNHPRIVNISVNESKPTTLFLSVSPNRRWKSPIRFRILNSVGLTKIITDGELGVVSFEGVSEGIEIVHHERKTPWVNQVKPYQGTTVPFELYTKEIRTTTGLIESSFKGCYQGQTFHYPFYSNRTKNPVP